jgi:UDP-3-O-[3-hydroxymyristoyl] glucosamine N-acyltransferase
MIKQSFTLKELADIVSATLVGDPSYEVFGVNTLSEANSREVSFLANSRYSEQLKTSQAGVVCVEKNFSPLPDKNFLLSDDPSLTFQKILQCFLPKNSSFSHFSEALHPTAIVHPSASIGKNVKIGPHAVIDANVIILENTIISSFVYIGPDVQIGSDCFFHPHVVIREGSVLKNRVILQPGVIIGSCGFGYVPNEKGEFKKLEQLGNVIIEDDVEIGANTTIDRARFQSTKIGKGTKIDNLVQIAHNVDIGPHNGIAAQTGIAGSSTTGSHVLMGGQVGLIGHVHVGDGSMLATRTGVSKNLAPRGKYRGSPALPLDEYNRQKVYVRKLKTYVKKIEELEKRILTLEKKLSP